jgi:molecular chaperone GrpE
METLMTEKPENELEPIAVSGDEEAAAENEDTDQLLIPEVAEARIAEYRDRSLRLAAEMENLRKRTARDVEHARKFGIEQFAREVLAVVDSLEMGLEVGSEASAQSLLEGNQATLKLLRAALDKGGIEVIDPEGVAFDPESHEAITMQPSNTAEPGSVLTVVQKGYQLNGRLLRPARVVVASEE